MILQVVALRDIRVDVFLPPFVVQLVGQAIRSFGDECSGAKKESAVAQHPDDFELMHLGSYDDTDGSFQLFPKPKQVAFGKDFVVRSN